MIKIKINNVRLESWDKIRILDATDNRRCTSVFPFHHWKIEPSLIIINICHNLHPKDKDRMKISIGKSLLSQTSSLQGLAFLHDLQIVHLDVKPYNILFCNKVTSTIIVLVLQLTIKIYVDSSASDSPDEHIDNCSKRTTSRSLTLGKP